MAHRLWLTGFVAVAISAAACTDDSVDPDDLVFPETTVASPSSSVATTSPSVTPPSTVPPTVIPRGGVVRLGVWGETDPEAETLTGAMIRSLTQPQLFVAGPDGLWNASLVEPGTDVDGEQFRSASFRLRDGAVWSDGSKIERDHLWDSADRRFVEGVDVADDGLYTISFNQPLPNWRHLWSGTAVVSPPKEGLFGGKWKVASFDPDLEVVLVPNARVWGAAPFLDELRLVVVPDQDVMFDLFEDGLLDVIAPNASPGRLPTMQELAPGRVSTAVGGGWWIGIVADPSRVELADRMALMAAIDPEFFVGALLKGEAVVSTFGGSVAVFPDVPLTDVDELLTITAANDVSMVGAVERAVLLAIRNAGGVVPELRDGTSDLVAAWIDVREADAFVALSYDGPGGPCWTCRFGEFDETAARLADGGGDTMDQLLADQGVARLLWRPVSAVAWAERMHGVVVNGWTLTPAWNAHEWWVD